LHVAQLVCTRLPVPHEASRQRDGPSSSPVVMDVLSLIHQEDAAAGVFAEAAAAAGHTLEEASYALGRPPLRPLGEYGAVIVFGGEVNVDQEEANPWMTDEKAAIKGLIESGRPVLGVCLGSQLLAEAAGANVGPMPGDPEVGWHEVERVADDPVLGVLPQRFLALEWHGYHAELPPGAVELARNAVGLQAFRLGGRPAWGIQFHAEATSETLARWIDDETDGKVDLEALAAESRRRIGRWNEQGKRLCGAFLEEAATR
jgi:GMP synthase-like glutamine amidotransferase